VLVITQNFVVPHFLPPRSGLMNLDVGATHGSYHDIHPVALAMIEPAQAFPSEND